MESNFRQEYIGFCVEFQYPSMSGSPKWSTVIRPGIESANMTLEKAQQLLEDLKFTNPDAQLRIIERIAYYEN